MRRLSRTRLTVVAVTLLVAGCAQSAADAGTEPDTSDEAPVMELTGSMLLEPSSGAPGTTVSLTGEGLPPDADLIVEWVTADGSWVLEGDRNEEYHGRSHNEVTSDLGTVTTDSAGNVSTSFVVPEGFGFGHDVRLVDAEGVVRNKALFDVDIEVRVTPTEGPVGTPITIEVFGMGWQSLENTRTVVYDNVYTGFMSAVTTDGYARAVIPAVGDPGPHRISILRGAYTFPYLNPQQSPRPDIPVFDAVFTVTDGEPVLPPAIEDQNEPATPRPDRTSTGSTEPQISTDYQSGPVETEFEVMGEGFEPGANVEFLWYRVVGNRVSGNGWDEQAVSLGSAVATADGRVTADAVAPHDVGGPHRIEAIVDETPVASVDFDITPSVASFTPTTGPWGTEIVINLTGVGWTETANIYTLTYDNSYIGYACGFNSQGDVEIVLSAVGGAGWHFIDLYPAIYKGKESPGQQNFRIPQLTYEDDHPGEDLPAFHLAFFLEG